MRPDALAALVDRQVDGGAFHGAALAVLKGHETVFERFAGQAAPGLPAGPSVLWPLASVTKLFTAAVVMRLVELGELTVNTPVWQVLPAFTGEGREDVRVRHLITHTSGLPYESPEMGGRLAAHTSTDALIDEAYATPLLFAPGSRFQYSDYAYGLAGRVAARLAACPSPSSCGRSSSSRWAWPTRSCSRRPAARSGSRRCAACSTTAPMARCTTPPTAAP